MVNVLKRNGMTFRESPTTRPGSGRSIASTSQGRSSIVHPSSAYYTPREEPFTLERGEVLTEQHIHVPRSVYNDHTYRVSSSSSEMPPPRLIRRDQAAAPRDVSMPSLSTAQTYSSYTTPPQQSVYSTATQSRLSTALPSSEASYSTLSKPSVAIPCGESVDYENTAQTAACGTSPISREPLSIMQESRETIGSDVSGTQRSPVPQSDAFSIAGNQFAPSRPASVMPDTLEHEIPPRRELPWERPGSQRSSSGRPSSRTTTSSLMLPPLPKPKITLPSSPRAARPASSLSISKHEFRSESNYGTPLKRPCADNRDGHLQSKDNLAAGPVFQGSAASLLSQRPKTTATRLNKPELMDGLTRGRQPLVVQSPNTKLSRLDSLADAPHDFVSPPGTARGPAEYGKSCIATNEPESTSGRTSMSAATIDNTQPEPRADHDGQARLREYAAQSAEDRQAALDEFMVQNLQNDDFTKLCQDIENSWRRIILGL